MPCPGIFSTPPQHIAPVEAMELYNCSQPYTIFCETFDAEDRYSAGLMAFLYVAGVEPCV